MFERNDVPIGASGRARLPASTRWSHCKPTFWKTMVNTASAR